MVTQTEITLSDGDAERIITDEEANQTYIVEVTGPNPVRVDHNKRYAADGTTLSANQSHTVNNLRGKELYAAAHAGSTQIRVRRAAANVESQPEQEITVSDGEISVVPSSNAGYKTQIVTGSGSFNSEIAETPEILIRSDPDNDDRVTVEGFPLEPGDGILLDTSDPSNISVTANVSTDETIALYGGSS
jgi:hypothetical protein